MCNPGDAVIMNIGRSQAAERFFRALYQAGILAYGYQRPGKDMEPLTLNERKERQSGKHKYIYNEAEN